MRYSAEPQTSCLSCDAGTFEADAEGFFDLPNDSAAFAAFASHGIKLTPHPDDLAEARAAQSAAEEAERLAAEQAAMAEKLAADAEAKRIFDEAVEREVAARLAAMGGGGSKKAPTTKPAPPATGN